MRIKRFPKIAFLKKMMPETLLGRSLMIIITPVLLLQIITSFIFIDRHWTAMSDRMEYAVAGEISLLVKQVEIAQSEDQINMIKERYAENLELLLFVENDLKDSRKMNSFVPPWMTVEAGLAKKLRKVIDKKLTVFKDIEGGKKYTVLIWLDDGRGLRIFLPKRRLFSSTSYIFILWLLGSSFVLFTVAAVFMRNQIRPIRKLAKAAERFGKGFDMPGFKPQGASEVRQAAVAFLDMRDRLKRQIEQRTAMLSGVSHDLRTPLTRMKLQLALLGDSPDVDAMHQDVLDMENMIEGYLAFARGEGNETPQNTNISQMLEKLAADARRQSVSVDTDIAPKSYARVRAQELERAIGNLITNACKYGTSVWLSSAFGEDDKSKWLDILIEDDGPGLPENMYEDVFKPFFRMDKSRNSKTGGVGLGLSIAKDTIHAHGGNITLSKSMHGGLLVTVHLPL